MRRYAIKMYYDQTLHVWLLKIFTTAATINSERKPKFTPWNYIKKEGKNVCLICVHRTRILRDATRDQQIREQVDSVESISYFRIPEKKTRREKTSAWRRQWCGWLFAHICVFIRFSCAPSGGRPILGKLGAFYPSVPCTSLSLLSCLTSPSRSPCFEDNKGGAIWDINTNGLVELKKTKRQRKLSITTWKRIERKRLWERKER